MTAANLDLPRTPPREAFVARVQAAVQQARERGLEPASVYITAEDALLLGLTVARAGTPGDPPRVLGLPIRLTTQPGAGKLYTKHGLVLGIGRVSDKRKA